MKQKPKTFPLSYNTLSGFFYDNFYVIPTAYLSTEYFPISLLRCLMAFSFSNSSFIITCSHMPLEINKYNHSYLVWAISICPLIIFKTIIQTIVACEQARAEKKFGDRKRDSASEASGTPVLSLITRPLSARPAHPILHSASSLQKGACSQAKTLGPLLSFNCVGRINTPSVTAFSLN